eukprot:TRINITY_DN3152_c0_g1_i2.p1 TRINITY_DN3152_c0_g1~~TRINITY_DN3152_c0_g1_i2.p1  ORF type:complete len:307 (-),score=41.97 TRINITY_DN3152_c0_g1_i2:32-952(-)
MGKLSFILTLVFVIIAILDHSDASSRYSVTVTGAVSKDKPYFLPQSSFVNIPVSTLFFTWEMGVFIDGNTSLTAQFIYGSSFPNNLTYVSMLYRWDNQASQNMTATITGALTPCETQNSSPSDFFGIQLLDFNSSTGATNTTFTLTVTYTDVYINSSLQVTATFPDFYAIFDVFGSPTEQYFVQLTSTNQTTMNTLFSAVCVNCPLNIDNCIQVKQSNFTAFLSGGQRYYVRMNEELTSNFVVTKTQTLHIPTPAPTPTPTPNPDEKWNKKWYNILLIVLACVVVAVGIVVAFVMYRKKKNYDPIL